MSFFATEIMDEEWGNYFELTTAGYSVLVAGMILVLLLGCLISNPSGKKKIGTRHLVFSAMAMALAMVTSMLKIWDMPMGGSVTLCSMLFITLVGYLFGLRTGLLTAVAYGFLQLVVDPYIISIPQMLVDYLFAFGALGLSGLCAHRKNGLLEGYILGVLGRLVFAFLSGVIFFGSSAAAYNLSIPVYSLVYNGSYLGVEAIITVVILSLPPVKKGIANIKRMALA